MTALDSISRLVEQAQAEARSAARAAQLAQQEASRQEQLSDIKQDTILDLMDAIDQSGVTHLIERCTKRINRCMAEMAAVK